MEDPLITEYAGTRRAEISRFYQYGSGGVRVLDSHKTVKRMYFFEPGSEIITERDPLRREKVLRRFVFDRYGMNEETFAFGERPRTFRYEDGARKIAVREGGDYGAVGKLITFEENGVTETAWGRDGEIERVYQFDPGGDVITVRNGGWFGDVVRTIVFPKKGAFLFREPEAFLQFLIFTEWSAKDRNNDIRDRVAQIRAGETGRSPYAYTGPRRSAGVPVGGKDTVRIPPDDDPGIDFVPDADAPGGQGRQPLRRSAEISAAERKRRDPESGAGTLPRGRSAEIPLDERFENAQKDRRKLSPGRSAEIPYSERRGNGDQ